AVTDLLDGWVARRLGQTSKFGEFLDPVADKLMVAVVLVLLVQSNPTVPMALVAAIIIGREITVSGLREWMATIGERANVAVSLGGKVKTTLQMIGIGLMVYRNETFGVDLYDVGFALLLLAADQLRVTPGKAGRGDQDGRGLARCGAKRCPTARCQSIFSPARMHGTIVSAPIGRPSSSSRSQSSGSASAATGAVGLRPSS